MSRYIDLDNLPMPIPDDCASYDELNEFAYAIAEAPTIDAVSEWIPCSERLPSESEQDNELGVLVTLGNGYSGIQFDWVRDGEHWYDWDGYVIAWMPLPKPYGEREDQ